VSDDQQPTLRNGREQLHHSDGCLPSLALYRDIEAGIQGCTELLVVRVRLQWERQRLLEQRHLLLERRIGLLERLQEEHRRCTERTMHPFSKQAHRGREQALAVPDHVKPLFLEE